MRIPPLLASAVAFFLAGCAVQKDELSNNQPTEARTYGAQLYTIRAAMERDAIMALRQVAAIGYDEVEFAGLFGHEPAELCREVRNLGMRVAASHVDWRKLRDDPATLIAETGALCSPTVVLAWLPPEERRTLEQWRKWIGILNRAAALAERSGIRIAYHAHDFEFEPIDGVRPIDLLLDGLDPRVKFELDVYWAAKAGTDPAGFLRRNPGRVTMLHLKDMAKSGAMADVGVGTIDFAAVLEEARRQGVEYYIVERDDAPDPWVSLTRSLDYLEQMALPAAQSPQAESELK